MKEAGMSLHLTDASEIHTQTSSRLECWKVLKLQRRPIRDIRTLSLNVPRELELGALPMFYLRLNALPYTLDTLSRNTVVIRQDFARWEYLPVRYFLDFITGLNKGYVPIA